MVETNDQIQTDSNGTYRMRARVGHTLRFTYYLHLTEEIQIHQDQDLYNFTLVYNPTYARSCGLCHRHKRESMILGRIAPEPVVEKPVDSTAVVQFKGTVLDDTGLPLPGVNILVKEQTKAYSKTLTVTLRSSYRRTKARTELCGLCHSRSDCSRA